MRRSSHVPSASAADGGQHLVKNANFICKIMAIKRLCDVVFALFANLFDAIKRFQNGDVGVIRPQQV